VKQLSQTSHQGKSQFVTEVATISAVQHRNLVKLYGCCIDSNTPLLVYEYLENRSLDQALFGVHTCTHHKDLTYLLSPYILNCLFLNVQGTVAA
jgi:serine/threonine protein kinase